MPEQFAPKIQGYQWYHLIAVMIGVSVGRFALSLSSEAVAEVGLGLSSCGKVSVANCACRRSDYNGSFSMHAVRILRAFSMFCCLRFDMQSQYIC